MLYLSEFTFPWADILLRKKDVPATAQQKGHFFSLYWPKVVMGLWNKFHLGWSGQRFCSYRGNLVWGLCCAEFEYVDLKIGLLVHIPVSEVFLLTVEVCWHGNSLNLALNAVSLAPGLPGLRTLLIERLSQGFLSAEDDALSCRSSWPMVFFFLIVSNPSEILHFNLIMAELGCSPVVCGHDNTVANSIFPFYFLTLS